MIMDKKKTACFHLILFFVEICFGFTKKSIKIPPAQPAFTERSGGVIFIYNAQRRMIGRLENCSIPCE